MRLELADPRRMIAKAYLMEGLGAGECRSIFLDWALGLPAETDQRRAVSRLVAEYSAAYPTHPMTEVLRAAAAPAPAPRRRGGAGARRAGSATG